MLYESLYTVHCLNVYGNLLTGTKVFIRPDGCAFIDWVVPGLDLSTIGHGHCLITMSGCKLLIAKLGLYACQVRLKALSSPQYDLQIQNLGLPSSWFGPLQLAFAHSDMSLCLSRPTCVGVCAPFCL